MIFANVKILKMKNKKIKISGSRKIKKKYPLTDYEQLEKFFKKMDQIWQEEFGKECKEFVPNCSQCKFSLIYNKFKQDVFDEVLK